MATSTTKGYPYPEDTDAPDVPYHVEALADVLDARPGVTVASTTTRDGWGSSEKWTGRVIFNTTDSALQVYTGSTWVSIGYTDLLASPTLTEPLLTLASSTSTSEGRISASGSTLSVGDGSATQAFTAARRKVDVQTFTSDGTWTKPTNATAVSVLLVGGGGGGGSGSNSDTRRGGGGGGGGGYIVQAMLMPASLFDATEAVDVGAYGGGASGVSGTAGSNGSAGAATTFAHLSATGGRGGYGGVSGAYGPPEVFVTADNHSGTDYVSVGGCADGYGLGYINITPYDGYWLDYADGYGMTGAGGIGYCYNGVNFSGYLAAHTGFYGSGGAPGQTDGASGSAATGYGNGGGGGGAKSGTGTSGAGGNGSPGYAVIVTHF